jgi:cytochrome c oxidase cbb3-type subunit IV
MTYQEAAVFAQSWGMFYAIAIFAGVVVYAMWPRNKSKFDRAARMPLNDDGPLTEETKK